MAAPDAWDNLQVFKEKSCADVTVMQGTRFKGKLATGYAHQCKHASMQARERERGGERERETETEIQRERERGSIDRWIYDYVKLYTYTYIYIYFLRV